MEKGGLFGSQKLPSKGQALLGLTSVNSNMFTRFSGVLLWIMLLRIFSLKHSCQFFLCNSSNLGTSPQNFLTFSFNPFSTLVYNFKFVPSASLRLLNLNQDNLSKKAIFLVKSLWSWGYDNFSHRNARVTKLCSNDHI